MKELIGGSQTNYHGMALVKFLNHLLPDQLCIGPAYWKALSVLHLYHHAAIKMFFNLLQIRNIDDGTAMDTYKNLGV